MAGSPNDGADRRIGWIQALRALAALAVAFVHLADGFARYVDHRIDRLPEGGQVAQAAVALFFVISGCVMVISSGPMFGRLAGTVTFWRRRAVRVLPPYWIATLLFAAVSLALALPVTGGAVARSLVFAIQPASNGEAGGFALFLWPGWTLLYELAFYALFGACCALGRGRAIAACGAALAALVALGWWAEPAALLPWALTRPVLLLFVAGMAAALVLPALARLPASAAAALVAGAAACFAWIPAPQAPLGFAWLAWAGVPAVLVFLAAGRLSLVGAAGRAATALGDASYAIYLLHVPFAHAWMEVFNARLGHPGGAIGYLAGGLPLLVALSIGFHRLVERPLTARLNRLLGGRGRGGGALTRSHAP